MGVQVLHTRAHTKIMTSPKANRDYGYLTVFQYFLHLSFEKNHVPLCCETGSLCSSEVTVVCARSAPGCFMRDIGMSGVETRFQGGKSGKVN